MKYAGSHSTHSTRSTHSSPGGVTPVSQALVGLALYFLWQLVPLHEGEKVKIEDPVDDKLVRDALVVPGIGMGPRAMSGQDLPLCTPQLAKLEYY